MKKAIILFVLVVICAAVVLGSDKELYNIVLENGKNQLSTLIEDSSYVRIDAIGYLSNVQSPGFQPVYDCIIPSIDAHMPSTAVPANGNCEAEGILPGGIIGYIATEKTEGYDVPVYRCFDPSHLNFFLSQENFCTDQRPADYFLGYIKQPDRRGLFNFNKSDKNMISDLTGNLFGYDRKDSIGFISKKPGEKLLPLYECYAPFFSAYMPSTANPAEFSWSYCEADSVNYVRIMGFIAQDPFEDFTIPAYRCLDTSTGSFFISQNSSCRGRAADYRLGYLSNSGSSKEPSILEVSVSDKIRPLRHDANGLLYTLLLPSANLTLLEDIRPAYFRTEYSVLATNNQKNMAKNVNATIIPILKSAFFNAAGDGVYPGDDDWNIWENTVKQAVAAHPDIDTWELWNEPDFEYFWPRPDGQYFEAWKRGYIAAKSARPNIKIVGPSVAFNTDFNAPGSYKYNLTFFREFLDYAASTSTMPDIISIHMITGETSDQHNSLQVIKNELNQRGLGNKEIFIGEYIAASRQLNPGEFAQKFSLLEKENVAGSRACWEDKSGESNCYTNTLTGLLTPDYKPRSVWWIYRKYADMKGDLLESDDTYGLRTIASRYINTTYLMIGNNYETKRNIKIKFKEALPVLGSSLNIKVEKVTNTELGSPQEINLAGSFEGVNYILNLQEIKPYEVFFVTLSSHSEPEAYIPPEPEIIPPEKEPGEGVISSNPTQSPSGSGQGNGNTVINSQGEKTGQANKNDSSVTNNKDTESSQVKENNTAPAQANSGNSPDKEEDKSIASKPEKKGFFAMLWAFLMRLFGQA